MELLRPLLGIVKFQKVVHIGYCICTKMFQRRIWYANGVNRYSNIASSGNV